ncbi:MAG: hypothetical protein ACOYD4_03945 [Solirubrobacterales bacterium]
MQILTVIPFCAADWQRAEFLLDWIYQQRRRTPLGHVLLACASDVHAEMKARVGISAGLAFENVSEFTASAASTLPLAFHLFRDTALHLGRATRWPWLCLEPDAVPITGAWFERIQAAYDAQPFRYMGAHCKTSDDALILGRVAIYPASAINDIDQNRNLVPLSSKSRLFQYGTFSDGDTLERLRPDAVLFTGSKGNTLIEKLRAESAKETTPQPAKKKASR